MAEIDNLDGRGITGARMRRCAARARRADPTNLLIISPMMLDMSESSIEAGWKEVVMEWLLGIILVGVFIAVLIYSNRTKTEDSGAGYYGTYENRESNPNYMMARAFSTEEVEEAIRQGADVNHLNRLHPTFWARPLHDAVLHDDPDSVRLLLKHGANPNGRYKTTEPGTGSVPDGATPLQYLLTTTPGQRVHSLEIVHELIAVGAKTNVTDGDGNTLLHLAARYRGDMQMVSGVFDELLAEGVSPNTRNRSGQTASALISARLEQHLLQKQQWEDEPFEYPYFDHGEWVRDNDFLLALKSKLQRSTN